MPNKIGIVLALDGEQEFTNALKNAQQSAKLFDQGLKNLEQEYKGNANSIEALTAKQEKLIQQQTAYNRELEAAKQGQKNAVKNYREAGANLEKLEADLKKANEALEEMRKSGDTSSKTFKEQEKAVKALENAVNKQSNEYAKASTNITRWDTNVVKAQGNVDRTNSAVQKNAKYVDEASKSADGCAKSIDKMGKELDESAASAGKSSEKFGQLKDNLKQAVPAMLGNLGADAAKMAVRLAKEAVEVGASFEQAMSKVEALSGASGSALEALSQKAQELGRNTQFSATEAAEALGNMALAGWDTQQMLDGIDGVLQLAASGGMDLASAADAVAGYLAAFNMQANESTKLVDIMATAQAKSKTTADQLSQAYSTCATNLTQAGQSVYTTTALIEGLASVNDTGSSAGTHLSAVMAQITQKMKDGKIAIGDATVEVKDANGNFRDMIDIVADVESAVTGMGDAEKAAALQATFNRTSMTAMNELLAVGSDKLRSYSDELKASSGASKEMMDTMTNNFEGAKKKLGSAAEGLGVAIYDKIKDPLTGMTDLAADAINAVTDALSPEIDADPLVEYIEQVRTARETLDNTLEAAQATVTDAFTSAATIGSLASELMELNAITEPTLENRYRMRTIVDELKTSIPELAGAYDSETGALKLTNEQIAEYITNKQRELIESAKAAAQQKILNDLFEAEGQKLKSDETLAEANRRVEALGRERKAVDGYFKAYQDMVLERDIAIRIGNDEAAAQAEKTMTQASENLEMLGYDAEDVAGSYNTLAEKEREAAAAASDARSENEALAEFIENAGQQLKDLDATADATLATLKEQTQETIEAAGASGRYAESEKKRAESQEKAAKAAKEAGNEIMLSAEAHARLGEASENALPPLEDLKNAAEQLNHSAEGLKPHFEVASDGVKTFGENVKEAAEKTKETKETLSSLGEWASSSFGNTVKAAGEKIKTGIETITEEINEKAKEKAQKIADIAKESAKAVTDAWEQMKSSAAQTITFSISSEFDGGDDLTTEKMNANLQSQIDGYKKYYENLQKLRKLVAEGIITPEFFTNLEQQGASAANEIEHMIWTVENQGEYGLEQIKSISDGWTEAMNWQEVISAAIAGDQAVLAEGLRALGSTQADFEELKEAVATGLSGVDEDMQAKIDSLVQNAEEIGIKIPEGLTEGINQGKIDAQAVADQLDAALRGAATGLQDVAADAGIQIPKSVSEGIEAGGEQAAEAYRELLSLILDGTGEKAEKESQETGNSISSGIAEGISDKEGEASEVAQSIVEAAKESASAAAVGFNQAGSAAIAGMRVGMSLQQGLVSDTARAVAQAGAEAASSTAGEYNAAGANAGSNFVSGVNSEAGNAYSAGSNVASSAKQGAEGITGWYDVGSNMMEGVKSGINAKAQSIADAAAQAVRSALQRAKQEAQIASPSKKFRDEVGRQLMAGGAIGITQNQDLMTDAAAGAMNQVLIHTKDWLKKNKKHITKELKENYQEAAAFAWKEAGVKQMEQGFGISRTTTTGSGDKQKTERKTDEKYYSEVYSAAQKYFQNVQTLFDVSTKDEREYWTNVRKNVGRGTQAWYDATAMITAARKKEKEETKKTREDLIANGDTYVKRRKLLNKMDAEQEEAYWRKIREGLKKGSEQWWEATERIKSAQEQQKSDRAADLATAEAYVADRKARNKMSLTDEINYWTDLLAQYKKGTDEYKKISQTILDLQEDVGTVSTANKLLSNYKLYYNMSGKAEMQYWNTVRKNYKAGTDERIEADQYYLEARAAYYEDLEKIETDYTEKIRKIEQERADELKKIDDKLAQDIDSKTKTYQQALDNRTKQIAGAFDLFSEFESKSASGEQLLFNMQSQAAGYKDWAQQIKQLENRGVLSDGLMQEIREKGPSDSAAVHALSMLSDEQLKQYSQAYDEKMAIANQQAAIDNSDLLKETNKEIEDLKKEAEAAKKELNANAAKEKAAAKEERDKAKAELQKGISADISSLAANIKQIASDQTSALVAAFTSKEGLKAGVEGSVGEKVSAKTIKKASAADLAAEADNANKKEAELQDTIQSILSSGAKRSKTLTASDKKKNSLYQYLVKNYGIKPTFAMNKKLAAALGVTYAKKSADVTDDMKKKLLAALKAHGFATGTKSLTDPFAWMDEAGIGSEMILRPSDGARLNTSVRKGDAIVPAANTDNLWEWSKYKPEAMLRSLTDSVRLISEASLNARAAGAWGQTQQQAGTDNAMAGLMEGMYALMQQYMPYIAQRQRIAIGDSDVRQLAAAQKPYLSNMFAMDERRGR